MNIDWNKIKMIGNRPASHVPNSINKLFSASETERENAYWELENYIVVQRRLFEAAYYSIDLISEHLFKHKEITLALDLLFEIARGAALTEDSPIVDEAGNSLDLDMACWNKIKKLQSRLETLVPHNDDSKRALEDLIETLNESKESQREPIDWDDVV